MTIRRALHRASIVLTIAFSHAAMSSDCTDMLTKKDDYFYYNCQAVFLHGLDLQSAAVQNELSAEALLAALVNAGLNKVRIWAYPWFMPLDTPAPWTRNAAGKLDLDTWDEAYWQKVRHFVESAARREVIVEFTLFAPYPPRESWWQKPGLAWNAASNINGAFTADDVTSFYPEFYDLNGTQKSTSGKTLRDYQRALIDKSVAELGDYGNLMFEIANEFPADFEQRGMLKDSKDWALHWARYLSSATSRLVAVHAHDSSGTHLRGLEYYADVEEIDVLNFHWYGVADRLNILLSERPAVPNKIWQSNESFSYLESEKLFNRTVREAWIAFLHAVSYSFFHPDKSIERLSRPAWRQKIAAQSAIATLASQFPPDEIQQHLPDQTAVASLLGALPATTTHSLGATNGRGSYLFYFWRGKRLSRWQKLTAWWVDVFEQPITGALPCGSYAYRWLAANSGKQIGNGTSDGCHQLIKRPENSEGDAAGYVLVIAPRTDVVGK